MFFFFLPENPLFFKQKKLLFLVSALCFLSGCRLPSTEPVLEPYSLETEAGEDKKEAEEMSPGGQEPASEAGDCHPAMIAVHVCGAVKKEGVYYLPEGSRLLDAVQAAGGFGEQADTTYLNLALKLEDSWQILVPTREEAKKLRVAQEEKGSPGEGRININTASAEELEKIPGIGRTKAKKILEYREKNGKFEALEDIMKVDGIKENSFQKMREFITF